MVINEGLQPLLPKDEILKWLESETARKTFLTLKGVDLWRHSIPTHMRDLYPRDEEQYKKLSPKEKGDWLLEQWPIQDVSWAAFVPKFNNKLIILDNHLSDHKDGVKNDFIVYTQVGGKAALNLFDFIVGTVATVKENGLKLFDLIHDVTTEDLAKVSAKGLANQGYLLLARDYRPDTEDIYFVPIFPE